MNTQLYQVLDVGYNFFLIDQKKLLPAVQEHERKLNLLRRSLNYQPKYVEKPISWGTVLFLGFVFLPFGILSYFLQVHNNKKEREKFEREVVSQYDVEAHNREVMTKIEEEEKLLAEAMRQRQEHYDKYMRFVKMIPEDYWNNLRALDNMRFYVKTGRANTMMEAMMCYGQDLRELDEMHREAEERREQEQQARAMQDKLDTIARNQKEIKSELETVRKLERGELYW